MAFLTGAYAVVFCLAQFFLVLGLIGMVCSIGNLAEATKKYIKSKTP
jgi:hypothetical protein